MKHLHTRISLYRPGLFIIGGPEPFKGLNLDQKKVAVRGEILITAVNFWFLTRKYCIWHIILLQIVPSKSMNAGKSNKGSLGWIMGPYSPQKSPKMVKKQQYFMIYSIRILSSLSIIKWPKSLYGTSFMKPLYTINASTVYYWGFKAP